jgi:hypothetical protein
MIKKAIFALIIFLLANTANAIITASWDANDPTEGVTKYTLYYKIANGTTETKLETPTNGMTLQDSSFEPGVAYSFSITATNSIGESPRSTEVIYTAPTTPPVEKLEPDDPSGIKLLLQRPALVQ